MKEIKYQQEIAVGYSVDIEIVLISELKTTKERYTSNGLKEGDTQTIASSSFTAGSYSLKNNFSILNEALIEAYNYQDKNKGIGVKRTELSGGKYEYTYYPIADFKRKAFKCLSVEYSDKTGRVSKMTFKEV